MAVELILDISRTAIGKYWKISRKILRVFLANPDRPTTEHPTSNQEKTSQPTNRQTHLRVHSLSMNMVTGKKEGIESNKKKVESTILYIPVWLYFSVSQARATEWLLPLLVATGHFPCELISPVLQSRARERGRERGGRRDR